MNISAMMASQKLNINCLNGYSGDCLNEACDMLQIRKSDIETYCERLNYPIAKICLIKIDSTMMQMKDSYGE
jgi:hypothetical protein